ncbi:hypothetical protein BN903_77 [Halorubrum sp. AJ67]|nr:hypothetical protein BN903_77 [Halorubrum sp. AJ67]
MGAGGGEKLSRDTTDVYTRQRHKTYQAPLRTAHESGAFDTHTHARFPQKDTG